MNTPHLLIIDDRKNVWEQIQMLSEAFGIPATHENPNLVYQNWKDVMSPSLRDLLWRISGEAIILIDPDFLSGIQDEIDIQWIEHSQEWLKNHKLIVLSGNTEHEALNYKPEYRTAIDFFRQKAGIELSWLTKPFRLADLSKLVGCNLEEGV